MTDALIKRFLEDFDLPDDMSYTVRSLPTEDVVFLACEKAYWAGRYALVDGSWHKLLGDSPTQIMALKPSAPRRRSFLSRIFRMAAN